MSSPASTAVARWAPIVAIAAACVILLVGLLVTTLPSGGAASGGAAASEAPAVSASPAAQPVSTAPVAESSSAASDPDSPTNSPVSGETEAASSADGAGGADSPAAAVAVAGEPAQEEPAAEEPAAEAGYDYGYDSEAYSDYAPAGEFWGVWIDSFYDMDAAYACADEASASGMPANVFEIADEGGSYYVVSAGEFSTRAEAEAVVSQAQQLGFYNAYTSTATYL